MARPVSNVGASVRARLLNLARQTGQPFDLLLTRFVLERLLYRLGRSPHAERFVLKGAMLLTTWLPHDQRGTRDLDLLGFGDPDGDFILAAFRALLFGEGADGVTFDVAALRLDQIRERGKYGGVRLRTVATLSGANITVLVDIGFGDAIEPGLEIIDYPVLLDLPAPRLRAYSRETVIAEKLHAMVTLGRANSRMKDFYDIWVLSRLYAFRDDRLARAIRATFARRETPVPEAAPDALTPAFAGDPDKVRQWTAFSRDLPDAPRHLATVVLNLADFLLPHIAAARAL
jgi:predicted nucleotidyltransferase component of viral defense system